MVHSTGTYGAVDLRLRQVVSNSMCKQTASVLLLGSQPFACTKLAQKVLKDDFFFDIPVSFDSKGKETGEAQYAIYQMNHQGAHKT